MPMLHTAETFLTLFGSSANEKSTNTGSSIERCSGTLPLLDARSPLEFAKGHIPGAINLPVLSDEERAIVGTAHARSGRDAAVHVALELIGPQLAARLERARHLTRNRREVLVHCWRGGMRSASLAWLLGTGGFTVHLLTGGYKAYRSFVRQQLTRPARLMMLGGMTGSGKTEILHEMARIGCQVIDLEGLAEHRGSAFGGVGLGAQPTNEMMENELYAQWAQLDFARPIWVEDENRHIGSVTLCQEFFSQMDKGRLIVVDLPMALRVRRLLRLYVGGEHDVQLLDGLARIRERLGHECWQFCTTAIHEQRHAEAIERILDYYDRSYAYLLNKRGRPVIHRFQPEHDDPAATARNLQQLEAAFALQESA